MQDHRRFGAFIQLNFMFRLRAHGSHLGLKCLLSLAAQTWCCDPPLGVIGMVRGNSWGEVVVTREGLVCRALELA